MIYGHGKMETTIKQEDLSVLIKIEKVEVDEIQPEYQSNLMKTDLADSEVYQHMKTSIKQEDYAIIVKPEIKQSEEALLEYSDKYDIVNFDADAHDIDPSIKQEDHDKTQAELGDHFIRAIKNEELEIKSEENGSKSSVDDPNGDKPSQICKKKRYITQKIIKCNPHVSKNKQHYDCHTATYESSLAATVYKCKICPFQTKYRKSLSYHNLKHQDPSEVPVYKCEVCLHQTIYRQHFSSHMLLHKEPSEVTMYKCELCPFQAKFKAYLTRHMLRHKSPSEVPMFKCVICPFQCKRKSNLKMHSLRHKNNKLVRRAVETSSGSIRSNCPATSCAILVANDTESSRTTASDRTRTGLDGSVNKAIIKGYLFVCNSNQ